MMKATIKIFLGTVLSLVCVQIQQSTAQIVSGNVFLKGKYVEIGIAPNQQYGTNAASPAGYHPRGWGGYPTNALGFVADPGMDGWTVGTPNYIGCYFLPGYPQEGWDMSINSTWFRSYAGNAPYGEDRAIIPSGGYTFTGSNTAYWTDSTSVYAKWEGSINDLEITTITHLDTNQRYFTGEVKLKNTGTVTYTNIYYSRTLDPDNESAVPGGGGPTTTNVIHYQPDMVTGDYKALVSATGTSFPTLSYLGIGAVDCRALVYIYPGSLNPSSGPHTIGSGAFNTTEGFTNVTDCAIGINFNIGDLAPGDSTYFQYIYVLRIEDLDTAFVSVASGWKIDGTTYSSSSDTFEYIICRGADSLDIEINGGNGYAWGAWEASSGPSYPPGRHNKIGMPAGPTVYRIIGATTVCPVIDTLYLKITPVGDTTNVTAEICNGSVYDFAGDILYTSGTYYKNFVTAMTGCDSVTKLVLTVNPTPNVDIQVDKTSLCEGESAQFQVANPTAGATYTWLRDGFLIPGATGASYTVTSQSGVYRVVGITSKGCTDTSRGITITINPAAEVTIDPINAGKVCIGDTLDFGVNEKLGYEYYWSPEKSFRYTTGARQPNVKGIMFEPENVIEVLAVNEYGCKDKDQIVVYAEPCCDVYVPTAFSPNGDGVNDYFNIKLQSGQKVVSFQIFDRFGAMVYDFNDRVKGWNGLINNTGAEANQAVYFYRIVYSCTDGRNYETKGDITLVR